jgi:hypothetical protein
MIWGDLALAFILASGLVLIPGVGLGLVAGLRGMWLWGLAGPIGVTVIATAAVAAPFVGISWGVLPVAIAAVALAVVVLVLRLLIWRRQRPLSFDRPTGAAWVPAVALVLPMVLILVQMLIIIGNPANISQTFDNVFHLNAIRYAVDHGNASPLFINSMTSDGGPAGFYPSGWHALGSLLVITGGVSVPVASNALTLFFPVVIWPASVVLLARVFGGGSSAFLLPAGALAAAIPAFPILTAQYGALFPYMMAVTLLPAALAVLVHVVLGRGQTARAFWGAMVILVGTIPGIVIAHPGAFMALLAFSALVLAVWFVYWLRDGHSRRAVITVSAAFLVFVVVLLVAWAKLRPPAIARGWPPQETLAQAIGEIAAAGVWGAPVNLAVAVFTVVGCVVAIRRRGRLDVGLLLIFLCSAGLYVVASGLPYWLPRDMLVGPWYNNAPRLAALLPLTWVPLAALGVERSVRWCLASRAARRYRRLVAAALSVGAILVLVALPQLTGIREIVNATAPIFRYAKTAPLLSADELALLNRLDGEVPKTAEIAGSPWTGTALAYALANRRVVMPHMLSELDKPDKLIMNRLNTAVPGSAVCAAIREKNVEYVLDFGTAEVNGGHNPFRGLESLSTSSAVKLVDHVGPAKLYRIVGC